MTLQQFINHRVKPLVANHLLIIDNPYTAWFSKGVINKNQMIDFITQYIVISSNFVAIQALRVANAETPESEKKARWILMTESGVRMDLATGSPEDKTFTSGDAHVNWIRKAGTSLGLDPMNLGRWKSADQCTKTLLTKLKDAYASPDSFGAGASFGLEVWAGYGIGTEADSNNFWSQIVKGIEKFNTAQKIAVDSSFFQFHHEIEIGHTNNVYSELKEIFDLPEFEPERWLEGAKCSMDALFEFWQSMDDRKEKL